MSVSSLVSIPSLFTPDELALAREWYKIRDLFLGQNEVEQDVKRALQLAAACKHADAVYMTKIFAGKDVHTKEEARKVFLAQPSDDARALCFDELVMRRNSWEWKKRRVRRSAELGFAFAQGVLALVTDGEERFQHARASAAQCERDGFIRLGCCFWNGLGCEQNIDMAKEKFLIAAELGHVNGMTNLGRLLDETDPQRLLWWGRASKLGKPFDFLGTFPNAVQSFKSGSGSAVCVFQIGRACNGRVDLEENEIFGKSYDFDKWIGPANDAIAFYNSQLAACSRAVDTWTLVGIRFGVVKDIRILIGKMIWGWRDLALYKI